jgi:hypothetical protein
LHFFSKTSAIAVATLGIDEDVIEVDDYANIEHVREDVIHESLKSGWRAGESKRHD